MTSSPVERIDLLDLKLLPAWVKEPVEAKRYADVQGEHDLERPARHHRGKPMQRGRRFSGSSDRPRRGTQRPITKAGKHEARRQRSGPDRHSARRGRMEDHLGRGEQPSVTRAPSQIIIQFNDNLSTFLVKITNLNVCTHHINCCIHNLHLCTQAITFKILSSLNQK